MTEQPEFSTSISRVAAGELNIRGYAIGDLVKKASASEAAFLTLIGRRPDAKELRMFEAILSSTLDHGFVNTLNTTGRYIVTGSASVPAALAGSILCLGPYTGTTDRTARFIAEIQESERGGSSRHDAIAAAVKSWREKGEPVPGYGHPLHKEVDPREKALREVAEEEGFIGENVEILDEVGRLLPELLGKQLNLNVDGLQSAVMMEMGFAPEEMMAVTIMSHLPGLAAHAIEELRSGRHLRYPQDHESAYELPHETRPWDDGQQA